MDELPHPSSTTGSAGAGQRFQLVRDVARALAGHAGIATVLGEVAALMAASTYFDDCSVWLRAEPGTAGAERPLRRVAASVGSTTRLEELAGEPGGGVTHTVERDQAGTAARLVVVPLGDPGGREVRGAGGEADGSLGVLAVRAAPLPLDGATGGEVVADDGPRELATAVAGMVATAIAHSVRREALESELARRVRQVNDERRFTERIIDSLPVGLYVIDRDYRIEVWNRKRETGLQGVSREEAVGRTIFEILHRQPAEMLRQEFEDAFDTGRVQHFSMESSSTGELRYYRITKIPMRDESGEVTHVITLGEDITDWREAQERFAQAEKLAAIGQLAAGVMHEINNPLATIAACAESLSLSLGDAGRAGAVVPAESGEYLRIVESEVQRCKRIVDRLLEFSRPRPLAPEPVDLNSVVEQTLFLLKHHSRFKRFDVQVELAPSAPASLAPVTRGNPEQLVQVLMAILINAMDSMGDEGTIEVVTRREAGAPGLAVVEVRDHGEGIARPQLAKIFEPFYTTKAPGRGTGLGLSICYGIVAEHGGRIEVESEAGEGSVFRIELPCALPEVSDAGA